MTMREATRSRSYRLATKRLPRPDDWRYAALGLQPTADQELIERAYWYQARRLRAQAETDREAARRLALLTEAYHALAPAAAEPWAARASAPALARARRRDQVLDILLTLVLLAVLAFTAVVVLNPEARTQLNLALQNAGAAIQHVRASSGH